MRCENIPCQYCGICNNEVEFVEDGEDSYYVVTLNDGFELKFFSGLNASKDELIERARYIRDNNIC